jgi:hypothetical protein
MYFLKRTLQFIFFFVLMIVTRDTQAQRYGTAVGLRLGNNELHRTIGITAQQRVLKRVTLEGIIQSDFSKNSTVHLMMQRHYPIVSKRLNYYYGAGVSSGWEESFNKDRSTRQIIHTYGNNTTGIDLIGGVELTVASTVFSLDYKPNFNLAGREEFFRSQVGVSARMVLVKSKEQDKRKRQKAKAKKKKQKQKLKNKKNSAKDTPRLKDLFPKRKQH